MCLRKGSFGPGSAFLRDVQSAALLVWTARLLVLVLAALLLPELLLKLWLSSLLWRAPVSGRCPPLPLLSCRLVCVAPVLVAVLVLVVLAVWSLRLLLVLLLGGLGLGLLLSLLLWLLLLSPTLPAYLCCPPALARPSTSLRTSPLTFLPGLR